MNKWIIGLVAVAIVGLVLGTAGVVAAQSGTPGSGYGMMGGRGGWGMMGQYGTGQTGLLHDEMIAAYAEALGLSVEDLNARLANGETMAQIASAQGLTVEEFRTLMLDARNKAIDKAVQDGTLTQEQADWMKTRSNRMMGGYGARGGGRGQYANPTCPYFQTVP